MHFDHTDYKILDALQGDAAVTNQALAALVHTSPATCLRRVKALVDAGVIERRVAISGGHRARAARVTQAGRRPPRPLG